MMGRIEAALCVLHVLLLGAAQCSSSTIKIRGLDPSLAEHYKPQGDEFKCLDGEKIIMYSLINDDFCDCFDGSDEPGTSACVHGKFYCRNRGYTPQLLNASMVDDGYCDCCDGSDESSGKCSNTCAQAGAAARAALKAKAATEALGAKVKEGYVKQALDSKAKWQQEAERLSHQIAQQRKTVEQWKVKKEGVEAAEAKEKERQDAETKAKEEAQKKIADAWLAGLGKADADVKAPEEPAGDHVTTTEPANAESADAAADEIISKAMAGKGAAATEEPVIAPTEDTADPSDDIISVVEQTKEVIEGSIEEALKASKAATDSILNIDMGQEDGPNKTVNPHEAAKKEEAAETAEERAKRIASQWIKDDSTAPPPPAQEPQEQPQDSPAPLAEDSAEAAVVLPESAPDVPETGFLANVRSLIAGLVTKLGFGIPVSDGVPSDSQKIKDTYWQHHNELAALETREAELKKQLSQDYGPNGEFVTLRDRCFTADVDKYVYEICPYGEAAQKDGASRTSLGSWKGFQEDYSFMSFSGGQICWNGPQRSMRVALFCGEKEHLQHVMEPSKCEYVAEFTTPAACSAENAQKLQQQVLEDEQALQGSHDEL